eukprot:SAG11_NODE_9225_length_931_cov_1.322115_1_plen_153_part_00
MRKVPRSAIFSTPPSDFGIDLSWPKPPPKFIYYITGFSTRVEKPVIIFIWAGQPYDKSLPLWFYHGITRPLNDLLKKGVNVAKAWTTKHSDAVAKIKNAMITYPVLRQYDPRKGLHLVTDASDLASGACLYQYDGGSPSLNSLRNSLETIEN